MSGFKAVLLFTLAALLGMARAQASEENTTTLDLPSEDSDAIPGTSKPVEDPGFRPPFGINNLPDLPNLLHNFFRPVKFTGKLYNPSIIAIIGDKPYISLEVFNKFSPFKWLMNAFQGKIQNICGFLAPPVQENPDAINPQNILAQLMSEGQGPLAGSKPPIRIFDIPALYNVRQKF